MSRQEIKLRTYRRGDEETLQQLIGSAYRNLEELSTERVKRLLSRPYFDANGFFLAEKRGLPTGCVGVFNLPAERHLVIEYLVVKEAFSNQPVIDALMGAALTYSTSKQPKRLKAVTPTIQPYVHTYQQFGFKPVRRILRIAWDTTKIAGEGSVGSETTVEEIREEEIDEASQVFVEGLRPYWDWYIEEAGGCDALRQMAADGIRESKYLAAKVNRRIVGVAAVMPQTDGEAMFSGVIVLPEFRMRRVGSALMNAALNRAKQMNCGRLVVHTVAFLDALAPGAVLYLKSGGRIEAEYLQLIRESP